MTSELISLAEASAAIHRAWPPLPPSCTGDPTAIAHEARRFAALALARLQLGRLPNARASMADVGSALSQAMGKNHWASVNVRKPLGLHSPAILRADARFEITADEAARAAGGGQGQECARLNLRLLMLQPGNGARVGAGQPPLNLDGGVVRPGTVVCRLWHARGPGACPGAANGRCPFSHPPSDAAWALVDDGAPIPRPAPPFSGKPGAQLRVPGLSGGAASTSSWGGAEASAAAAARAAAVSEAAAAAAVAALASADEEQVPPILTWGELLQHRGALAASAPARQALAAALERVWDPRESKEQLMLGALARVVLSAALASSEGGGPAALASSSPPSGGGAADASSSSSCPPLPGGSHGGAYYADDVASTAPGAPRRPVPPAATFQRRGGEVVARVLMSAVGVELRDFWRRQRSYDFEQKPFASLSSLVDEHDRTGFIELDSAASAATGARCVTLRLSALFGGAGPGPRPGARNAVDGLFAWVVEMLNAVLPAGQPRGDRREVANRALSGIGGRMLSGGGGGGSSGGGGNGGNHAATALVRELLGPCVPAIAFHPSTAGPAAASPPAPGLSPVRARIATSRAEVEGLRAGGTAVKGGAGSPAYFGRAVAASAGMLQLVRLGPDWIADASREEGVCVQINLRRLAALASGGGAAAAAARSSGGGTAAAAGAAVSSSSAAAADRLNNSTNNAADAHCEDEEEEHYDDDFEEEDEEEYLDEEDRAQLAMLARLRAGSGGGGGGGGAGGSGAGGSGAGGSGATSGGGAGTSGGGTGWPGAAAAAAGGHASGPSASSAPTRPYGATFRSWDPPPGWGGSGQQAPQARAEVAVRLVSRPDAAASGPSSSSSNAGADADARAMLELQQHLAAVPLFSVFVPCWKGRAQLVVVFCPHAAVGLGAVALPSTAYLLDVSGSRHALEAAVSAIRPAMEDDQVVTVMCGARTWLMQANAALGASSSGGRGGGGGRVAPLRPRCALDVQQMRALEVQLRRHGSLGGGGTGASEVRPASLKQLTLWAGLFHPVRHDPRSAGGIRPWQERPLPADCVECAAADTVFLVLVCEWLAPLLQRAASRTARVAAPAPPLPGGLAPAIPWTASSALAAAFAMPAHASGDAVWARLREAARQPELQSFLTQG